MTAYFELPPQDQKDVLDTVTSTHGIPQEIAEKDIWLCWALETLFRMPGALPMAFKGGTSLSKVFNAIHRISEDIDISIDIRSLADLPADFANMNGSQTKKLREQVEAALLGHTGGKVLPWLKQEADSVFGADVVRFSLDAKGEGLRIAYPTLIEDPMGYLRPDILLEFGGRNVTDPRAVHNVKPYAADLGLALSFPEADAWVLSPMRTFWEKATLIHLECQKTPERTAGKSERMSRHWSDLANLADHDIGAKAVNDYPLAESVVIHKGAFFRDKAADYPACLNGGLLLVPQESRRNELEIDFRRMVDTGMFYNAKPNFKTIMDRLGTLQRDINALMKQRIQQKAPTIIP